MKFLAGKSEIIALPFAFTFDSDIEWGWRIVAFYIGPFYLAVEWKAE